MDGSVEHGVDAADLERELDALLDEVDAVLEENAEEFVKAYVQKRAASRPRPESRGPSGASPPASADMVPLHASRASTLAQPRVWWPEGVGAPSNVRLHVHAFVPLTVDLGSAPAHRTRRTRRSREAPSPSIPPTPARCR